DPSGLNVVYVGEQAPSAEVPITFPGSDRTRRVSANACGLITLKDTTSAPLAGLKSLDGVNINQATLPVRLIPRCVNGILEEARTADFKTGYGDVVIVKAPNTSYPAIYTADVIRKVRANACGFASVRGSIAAPSMGTTQIKIGAGTATTVSSIATAPSEPVCRNSVLYTPEEAAWNQ
ncbi:MAG: hypothetical protein LH702_12085, partial [Phormidesmis sp. CAN_BIN44]|nr:hypothetical protein [Phormidesmis sp. CAN_BIN44]